MKPLDIFNLTEITYQEEKPILDDDLQKVLIYNI